jgi:hypothetical protein
VHRSEFDQRQTTEVKLLRSTSRSCPLNQLRARLPEWRALNDEFPHELSDSHCTRLAREIPAAGEPRVRCERESERHTNQTLAEGRIMKRLFVVLLVLVVGIVGFGFYRGWFTANQDKIQQDEQRAKEEIRELIHEVKDKTGERTDKKQE